MRWKAVPVRSSRPNETFYFFLHRTPLTSGVRVYSLEKPNRKFFIVSLSILIYNTSVPLGPNTETIDLRESISYENRCLCRHV